MSSKANHTNTNNNNMASSQQQDGRVPAAPYPPMPLTSKTWALLTSSTGNKSASSPMPRGSRDSSVRHLDGHNHNNMSSNNANMAEAYLSHRERSLQLTGGSSNSNNTIIGSSTPTSGIPSRVNHHQQQQQLPKRQAPSKIEFYNSQFYGAINCLDHIGIGDEGGGRRRGEGVVGGSTATSTPSFPVKKLGPVLLELRYLHPSRMNPDQSSSSSSQSNNDGNWKLQLQSHTIALSRGISSLGTNVSSTCLSFRSSHPSISNGISGSGSGSNNIGTAGKANRVNDIPQLQVATGLTTGALCIHTLRNLNHYVPSFNYDDQDDDDDNIDGHWEILDSNRSEDASVSYFSHYQPRQHRHASAVAWRPGVANSNFVAIGLVGSSGAVVDRVVGVGASAVAGGVGMGGSASGSVGGVVVGGGGKGVSGSASGMSGVGVGGVGIESYRSVPTSRVGIGSSAVTAGNDYHSGGYVSSKERDYCALVWDIEASSKGVKQTPVIRLAHNSGVASLAWMSNGDLLAVGCMQRSIQIYDLRIQGTSAPPISTNAHDNAVHGIKVDPHSEGSFLFATFSKGLAEPVKLWDMRRMDSCVSEIKLNATKKSRAGAASNNLVSVSDVEWDTFSSGVLSVVSNDIIRYYDTRNNARPALTRITNCDAPIQSVAFQPRPIQYQRMMVIDANGFVRDLPLFQVAPVAISNRDGRLSGATEGTVWAGSTTEGPSAMERLSHDLCEDISATMMRRARCLHLARYSTDASSNLKLIQSELESISNQADSFEYLDLDPVISSREHLWRLWSWIDRVEQLCTRTESAAVIDERRLPARGLQDAGILKLLKMDVPGSDEITTFETTISSSLFNRDIFDSPMRRAVLTACGWVGVFGIQDALAKIEAEGNFERSATLAVWNSNIADAVDSLQRGAERIRSQLVENGKTSSEDMRYAETLELVAMCIAGYSGSNDPQSKSAAVWKRACESLLKRSDLNVKKSIHFKSRGAYLRAVCTFLLSASETKDLSDTLDNELLSLSDRCAFASIFLPRDDLKNFLEAKVTACIDVGNLEGILITGLDHAGFSLLQSYVDRFSDVQTAALVSSRVILPPHMSKERMIASEWLETYREMLNKWQMWQSRALFDVGRVELLRKLRQHAEDAIQNPSMATVRTLRRATVYSQTRRPQLGMKQLDSDSLAQAFPPQIQARCNYCNTSLSLSKLIRRQDGIANNWLSRQNPVLSCCPNSQCRKPLPRCAICLLPLGCLNPYLELRKHGLQSIDDLSELSNLPFAEWFTWCMRCKHGGHAHHMVGWFSNHSTCPVSNCNCQCQFDGIQKLKRAGLARSRSGLPSK